MCVCVLCVAGRACKGCWVLWRAHVDGGASTAARDERECERDLDLDLILAAVTVRHGRKPGHAHTTQPVFAENESLRLNLLTIFFCADFRRSLRVPALHHAKIRAYPLPAATRPHAPCVRGVAREQPLSGTPRP